MNRKAGGHTYANFLKITATVLMAIQGAVLLARQWRRLAMSRGLIQPETRRISEPGPQDLVTEASQESFPASDPPAFANSPAR